MIWSACHSVCLHITQKLYIKVIFSYKMGSNHDSVLLKGDSDQHTKLQNYFFAFFTNIWFHMPWQGFVHPQILLVLFLYSALVPMESLLGHCSFISVCIILWSLSCVGAMVAARVVTLLPPTSAPLPQVGKLVVACRWSAVYSTEP